MSEGVKARKGDLVLIERTEHCHWSLDARAEARAAGRELPETTTAYTFGVVASATRDGVVKTWRPVGYGADLVSGGYARPLLPRERAYVIPAKTIDVTGVLRAAKEHHWPGHPDQPKPFDSLDEAKLVARPFLIEAAVLG